MVWMKDDQTHLGSAWKLKICHPFDGCKITYVDYNMLDIYTQPSHLHRITSIYDLITLLSIKLSEWTLSTVS